MNLIPQDIRNAARRLWLLVHPDKTHAPRAAEAFRAVRDAEQEMLLKVNGAKLLYLMIPYSASFLLSIKATEFA